MPAPKQEEKVALPRGPKLALPHAHQVAHPVQAVASRVGVAQRPARRRRVMIAMCVYVCATYTHTHTHLTPTHINTHIHTHINTHIHTHINTHIHTHTQETSKHLERLEPAHLKLSLTEGKVFAALFAAPADTRCFELIVFPLRSARGPNRAKVAALCPPPLFL